MTFPLAIYFHGEGGKSKFFFFLLSLVKIPLFSSRTGCWVDDQNRKAKVPLAIRLNYLCKFTVVYFLT